MRIFLAVFKCAYSDEVNAMINIAQIGCGYWGPNLLRNLVANKDCNVKVVIDLSEKRREFINSLYPAITVSDNTEMVFDDPSVNAVVIATPVAMHFDLTMRSLAAGKHVLVEKPMATTVSEIEQIAELAEQRKLVAMAGHTFLYNAAVRYLKKLIDSNELGDVRYIYSKRLNLGRIRSDVDALWNFAPHDVSIIQYLLNNQRPISVIKHGMDYVQEGIDDVVFLHLVYPDKIMAHIHVSWLDPDKVRKMIVVGSKKMAVYDDASDNKIAIFDKGIDRMAVLGEGMDYDQPQTFKFYHRSGDIIFPKINFIEPLETEIAHFFDCIHKKAKCLTGVEHAREVIKILSWDAKNGK